MSIEVILQKKDAADARGCWNVEILQKYYRKAVEYGGTERKWNVKKKWKKNEKWCQFAIIVGNG